VVQNFNFKVWHPRCVLITVYKEWILLLPGHVARKLTFQPTTPPDFRNSAPPVVPRDPCSSPDITTIRSSDIIYVYCQDARDLDIIVFFLFVVAYCTQLLSQAMCNLMMATTMAETCSC